MATFKQYSQPLNDASEAFSIESFAATEIKVRVDGVLKTAGTGTGAGASHDYELQSYTVNGGTVAWVADKIPAQNAVIRIYREVAVDPAQATYSAGASVKAGDLNNNQTQALRGIEETQDQLVQNWEIEPNAVQTTQIKDDAVTSAKLDTNIDVAGTLDVTGATTLDSSLTVAGSTTTAALGVDGNFDVNTNKFTVASATGNTVVAGDLSVTGITALTGNVSLEGNIDLKDNDKLLLGNDDDVELQHNGSHTYLTNKTGVLLVRGDDVRVQNESGSDAIVELSTSGGVHAYHGGNKKIETTSGGISVTGAIVVSSTVDGRDIAADGTKLDGIEAGSKGDQTAAEIRTLVEAASDSNVFTDADHSKLNAIEASADVTDATNVDAAGAVMNSDLDGKGEILIGDGSGDPTALAVGTNDYVLTADSGEATGVKWAAAAGGGSAITVQEEGASLSTAAATLNFVGANVTASGTGATKTITVSGGGEVTVQDEGSALSTAATTLNFVGAGVVASGTGATKTITISGSGGGAVSTDFKYLELKAHNNASGAFSAGSADYELVTKGTTTAITPSQAAALIISVSGVIQEPNTGTSIGSNDGFCIDGSSIHFGANLTAHPDFILYLQGAGVATIGDNTVTGAKIALGSDAAGDIMYYNGTDYARLGVGSAGQMLQVNSGASAPEWGAAPSGTTNLSNTANGTSLTVESSSGTNTALPAVTTSAWGVMTDEDKTKLDGIETGATADQTNAEIRTAVEAATDSNVFTDADHTKLDGIAASANNYVHPNHSGEVTSTADGATVITDDIVDEANLKISNAGSNGQFLSKQSGNTGGLTWADAGGTVADGCIYENAQTISNNYTISTNFNALSAGPITISATLTIPSGSVYTIV